MMKYEIMLILSQKFCFVQKVLFIVCEPFLCITLTKVFHAFLDSYIFWIDLSEMTVQY